MVHSACVRREQLTVLFGIMLLLVRAVTAQNSTNSYNGTSAYSTLIPIVDTYTSVVENALYAILAFPLLLLSAWIIVVIFVAHALPKSNFVYHVFNLAIADVAVGLGDIVAGIEIILAPNSLGGLSSVVFSTQWGTFGCVISETGITQHYLAMAVIAVDRLYSILRPVAYKQRGPPVVITAVMNVCFAANLVLTACCFTIEGEFTNSVSFNIALSFNEYLTAALVFATVFVYVALLIANGRQKRVGPQNTAKKQPFDRQKQLTQTVARVAIIYIATALTSTIASLILNQLSVYSLITVGAYDAAFTFCFIPMAIGQFADLAIFAVKIDSIAEPSVRYLKKMRECGKPPQVHQPKRTTRSKPIVTSEPVVAAGGDLRLADVDN